ncbi:MAG: GNAT family N-acetyltransferase [Gemmatimonas sp.]
MPLAHDEDFLQRATDADALLLGNLLELYIHDLSAIFPHVTLGPDGRFGYAKLPLYFTETATRFPFLIRRAERILGFALVTVGSPASSDATVLDVAEFFVLRQFRREGVARRAAMRLWEMMPGQWTVRVGVRNTDAMRFWTDVLSEFTNTVANDVTRSDENPDWRVYSFIAPKR